MLELITVVSLLLIGIAIGYNVGWHKGFEASSELFEARMKEIERKIEEIDR